MTGEDLFEEMLRIKHGMIEVLHDHKQVFGNVVQNCQERNSGTKYVAI